MEDVLNIAGITFRSRLWIGTGKYASFAETKEAVEASGADVVTVAVRRTNITDRSSENLLDYIDPKVYKILPNTAGCYTAEDAMRYARLASAAGISDMVKLEVIGDERTLFPDNEATLYATKELVKEGFIVFPYVGDDPVMCKKLRGRGRGGGDAACGADRLRPWNKKPVQLKDNPGDGQSPGNSGRGSGDGVGRGFCDGTRRGGGAVKYRGRRRKVPDSDGKGYEARRGGGTAGV